MRAARDFRAVGLGLAVVLAGCAPDRGDCPLGSEPTDDGGCARLDDAERACAWYAQRLSAHVCLRRPAAPAAEGDRSDPTDAIEERWEDDWIPDYEPVLGACTPEAGCPSSDSVCEETVWCEPGPIGRAAAVVLRRRNRYRDGAPFFVTLAGVALSVALARDRLRRRRRRAEPPPPSSSRSSRAPGVLVEGPGALLWRDAASVARDLGWGAAAAGASGLAMLATAWAWDGPLAGHDELALLLVPLLLGLWAAPVLSVLGVLRGRRVALGNVGLEAGGVRTAALRIGIERVRQGVALGDGVLLLDLDDGRSLEVRAPSVAEASRALEALALDPARRAYTVEWVSRAVYAGALLALGGVPLAALAWSVLGPRSRVWLYAAHDWLEIAAAFAAIWLVSDSLAAFFARRRLTIGLDGVALEGPFGARHLRYADLSDAVLARRLVLVLATGGRVTLRGDLPDEALRDALDRRMGTSRALAKWLEPEGRALAERLARAGRSVQAWRAEVAALATGGQGFRQAATFEVKDAIALALSPASEPDVRIGAAFAVASAGAASDKARIVEASRACATVPLAAALVAAVEAAPDPAVIEAALREAAAPVPDA